jgi:hypothetical protein
MHDRHSPIIPSTPRPSGSVANDPLIVQYPAYPRGEIGVGERFENDLDARIEASLMDDGVAYVAVRIEDLEPWLPAQRDPPEI